MPYSVGRTMETKIFTPCIHWLVGTALLSNALAGLRMLNTCENCVKNLRHFLIFGEFNIVEKNIFFIILMNNGEAFIHLNIFN